MLERRLARSEAARAQAETLLEDKSRVLAIANEELQARKADLQRNLERRTRQLLDAQRVAGFATLTYDVRARRLELSPQVHEMFGVDPARPETGFRDLLRRVVPQDRRRAIEWVMRDLLRPAPRPEHDGFRIEVRCFSGRKRSAFRWVKVQAQQERDARGRLAMIAITVQDITRQVLADEEAERLRARDAKRLKDLERLNAKLTHAREAAERASQAKSRFLAMMSHDIRTPLNGVIGMLAVMDETGLHDEQRQAVRLARASGEQLRVLVDDIIDLARAEAGKLELSVTPVAIRTLLEDGASFWRFLARQKGLALDFDADAAVPAWVEADPARLRQLVDNLLSNAIKYSERGAIRLAVTANDGALSIAVTDQGIGIPKARVGLLFRDFTQLHLAGNAAGGAGLGLAICRRIVEVMGGEIGYEPAAGGGSRFWIRLPLRAVEAPEKLPTDEVPPLTIDGARRPRVLVAEDVATNRIVAARHLDRLGCDAVLVENGRLAMEAMRSERFDLVLMDVAMPVMDGPSATSAIRALGDDSALTPIVALTAYARPEELAPMMAAGANGSAAKPIRLADLRAVMASALERPRRHA